MQKWIGILFVLAFLNAHLIGTMKEKSSLESLREAGIPVRIFEEAEITKEDMVRYLGFWDDLKYFPLAGNSLKNDHPFFYENTWHEKRSYQGERLHEGCDIFGEYAVSDYYPVISITEGVIEKIGWLPLGGWRIGVRSPGGGYFYYAHLSSYGKDYQEGDQVNAGEVLGFLGDTGYGSEGTEGKFPPHLHLGIYVCTEEDEEYALNPYPVLEFLQEKQKNFFY